MYVFILITIILLGIILLLQWKRIHGNKKVLSHKENYHIESLHKEIDVLRMETARYQKIICNLKRKLDEAEKDVIRSKNIVEEYSITIKELERGKHMLEDELEKNKKRLYSIEISLNKVEYDKH